MSCAVQQRGGLTTRARSSSRASHPGFWDFTADLKHGDLAYSNVVLNAHTDTTYFTDVSPATLRPLSCHR